MYRYISQVYFQNFTSLNVRFINDGSVIRKLNLDNIPLVQFFWFSWMDSLSVGGVRIFFIVSMYHPKANHITDSDLTAYVHEYDEYSGRRSLIISLGLLCYTPLDETYPLLSQLLNSGFKFYGHDGYPISVINSQPQVE